MEQLARACESTSFEEGVKVMTDQRSALRPRRTFRLVPVLTNLVGIIRHQYPFKGPPSRVRDRRPTYGQGNSTICKGILIYNHHLRSQFQQRTLMHFPLQSTSYDSSYVGRPIWAVPGRSDHHLSAPSTTGSPLHRGHETVEQPSTPNTFLLRSIQTSV